MTRNSANKILIPLMTLLAINQALTVLLSDEMSREAFEVLHKGGGVVFLILIAVHLALNFNWVKANYFSRRHGT
jgi:hypothetical protein